MQRREVGQLGERIACEYLARHGYVVVARNFFARVGEIDIIARHDDTLAFIEVKTRASLRCGTPEEAVHPQKVQRLRAAAKIYLSRNNLETERVVFQALAIVMDLRTRRAKVRLLTI